MAELIHEGKTLEEVGKLFGLTRERVRQIFNATTGNNVMATRKALLICKLCGKKFKTFYSQKEFCCIQCKTLFDKFDYSKMITCIKCGGGFYPHRNWKQTRAVNKYCSMKCYIEDGGRGALSRRFLEKVRKMYEDKKI